MEEWKSFKYLDIISGYEISNIGRIRSPTDGEYQPRYKSSNGYVYDWFLIKDGTHKLYPIDEIVALAFVDFPKKLVGKQFIVKHINGNPQDNDYRNLQWVEDIEEWRWLIYPGVRQNMYMISNHGRLMRACDGRIASQHLSKKGYSHVSVMKSNWKGNHNATLNYPVHRLVATMFIKHDNPCDNQVNHIDGNKLNNHFRNLEWVNNRDNQIHAQMSGLAKPRPSKISTKDVDYIRELLLEYDSPMVVYNMIDHQQYPNMTLDIIRDIRRNKKTYARSNKYDLSKIHFDKLYSPPPITFSKIPISDIDMIRTILMEMDGSPTKTFNKLKTLDLDNHVTLNVIHDIKSGKMYLRSEKYDLTKSTKYPWVLINN